MAQIIELPKLSATMQQAVLVRRLCKEGDSLAAGEGLVVVKADQVRTELRCENEAVVLKYLAQEGDTMNLGAPIAIVGRADEDISEIVESLANAVTPAMAAFVPTPPIPLMPEFPTAGDESSTALAVLPTRHLAIPGADGEHVDKPLSKIRRTIADRLTAAQRDVPHLRLTASFEAGPLLHYRKRLNRLLSAEGKVTINDLLIKGVALTLRRVPECNSAFLGDAIRYYTHAHIGVAIALEQGLITAVVRDADLKGLGVIGAEMKDLEDRAKKQLLHADELKGSTFTLSNLGMFGIDHFDGVITPPESALLTVGRTVTQPIINEEGKIAVGQRISMTLSCDRRVIDAVVAARFLAQLVSLLEAPESLAL